MKFLTKAYQRKPKMRLMLIAGIILVIPKIFSASVPSDHFFLNFGCWLAVMLSFSMEDAYPHSVRGVINFIIGIYPFICAMVGDATRITGTHTLSLAPSLQFIFGEDFVDFGIFIGGIVLGVCALLVDTAWNPEKYSESKYFKLVFESDENRYQMGRMVAVAVMVNCYLAIRRYNSNKKRDADEVGLLKLNNDLKIALQEKENYILRFSHEIRNPLNSLLGNIDLLTETNQDPKSKIMLCDAKVCGEILLQLLNNILDSAKIGIGKLEVAPKQTRVKEFFERFWTVASEMIRSKSLYGALHLHEHVPDCLMIDNHRMMQIMINLISNATKFTDRGFVTIHVSFVEETDVKHVNLSPSYLSIDENSPDSEELSRLYTGHDLLEKGADSFKVLNFRKKRFGSMETMQTSSPTRKGESAKKVGFLRIEVNDSGCGIESSKLCQLFNKFSQVNDESTKRQIGTGLGLWITKELVELLKGDIRVFSVVGMGTNFSLAVKTETASMPQVNSQASEVTLTKKPSIGSRGKTRVLVMEDNPYNQEINRKFLTELGVSEVVIAPHGKEGVEVFRQMGRNYFDFIISDLDMPVMDGVAACKEIRTIEKTKGWVPRPIVILTGHSNNSIKNLCLSDGGGVHASRFYSKPASFNTFKDLVSELTKNKLKKNITNNLDFHVLVVDDDAFNLKMMADMASRCKCKVITATNGKIAVDQYQKYHQRVLLIFMDCEMPIMDGIESTRRILEEHSKLLNGNRQIVKIIGLTGHHDEKIQQRCRESGMADVLIKPIDFRKLDSMIKAFKNSLI